MCKISKISPLTLHITYFTLFTGDHIQAQIYCGLVLALLRRLLVCSATILFNTIFLCRLQKNKSLSLTSWKRRQHWLATTWPLHSLCKKRHQQNRTAVDKLKYVLLTSSTCWSCWGDILLLLLLYLKLFSCKNTTRVSDINSNYRMENLLVWHDKVTLLLFSHESRQMKFARVLHPDSVPFMDQLQNNVCKTLLTAGHSSFNHSFFPSLIVCQIWVK